jgi:DNA-binding MarR family transcriptional regulator
MVDAPAHELGYLIKRVQQALRGAIDPALAGLGLTMAQYAVLYNLERNPGLSNAELARLAFVTPQAMVRVVAELEHEGLLTRRASPAHAKVLQARLTNKGVKMLAAAQSRVDQIHATMLEGFAAKDIDIVAARLIRIAQRLEQLRAQGGPPGPH